MERVTSERVQDRRRFRDERGANLVEYALLIALIVLVCVGGVAALGQRVPADGFMSITAKI